MKKMTLAIVASAALLLSSCGMVKAPMTGFLYTDLTSGQTATSNSLGTKVGRATAKGYLGLIATGDASIETAAKSAGIKKISHIDEHANSILGIITTYEVIVYGE
ncbi:MAG: TRL-like family protein [Dysgonomonas sp.]|nr:TRL-like family protein [Dysgonomonas sp.]